MSDSLCAASGVAPVDAASTFVDLLRWRAEQQPDQCIYIFLLDGETEEARITYGDLDRQARVLGALLQSVAAAGERALLIYPPGLDYVAAFLGCLYAGLVAVPAYPPDPARLDRTLPRLRAIVHDARPAIALTTSPLLAISNVLTAHDPIFSAMRWLATDTADDALLAEWCAPRTHGDTPALLQYTSGSTAAPKGVILTHGNLLHNSAHIQQRFVHTAASRGVIWLPPYHDMGLIGGILQPLYVGFPVTLMSPVDFLQRPLRWLQAIARYKATTSGGPNFAYDLCVRKITPEQRAMLDLSSWTVAFTGAEPIRPGTLEHFTAAFAPSGFRSDAFLPCYGLAEATLLVTSAGAAGPPLVRAFRGAALERNCVADADPDVLTSDVRLLVGCGQPLPDQQLVIADPESLARCPPSRIGEIWVAGPSVAQGYWEQHTETYRSFHASLAETRSSAFLRTGDLGFVQDGELFVTGRLKDLITIRGDNHYPQDIELTVERSHPALRPGCGAAFSVELAGEERLVVMQEVERQHRHVDVEAAARAIRQAVAEQHGLQVYAVLLLEPGQIPKTSSGKIQRHACRAAFLSGDLALVGSSLLSTAASAENVDLLDPADLASAALLALGTAQSRARLEAYLQSQAASALRIHPASIDRRQPLNALGLDSLAATELQHAIETHLGVALSMVDFLQDSSIARLATRLDDQLPARDSSASLLRTPIQRAKQDRQGRHYPLSFAQERLWLLDQLAPGSTTYTIPIAVRLRGALDLIVLQRSLNEILRRHDVLHATFAAPDGRAVQLIAASRTLSLSLVDLREIPQAGREAAALRLAREESQRPFDLTRGPLVRAGVLLLGTHEHTLLLTMHHIVSDGWSIGVLVRELAALYEAFAAGRPSPLLELPIQYVDYAIWQREWL